MRLGKPRAAAVARTTRAPTSYLKCHLTHQIQEQCQIQIALPRVGNTDVHRPQTMNVLLIFLFLQQHRKCFPFITFKFHPGLVTWRLLSNCASPLLSSLKPRNILREAREILVDLDVLATRDWMCRVLIRIRLLLIVCPWVSFDHRGKLFVLVWNLMASGRMRLFIAPLSPPFFGLNFNSSIHPSFLSFFFLFQHSWFTIIFDHLKVLP